MNPIVIALFIATALLMACVWQHRFITKEQSYLPIVIGLVIGILDYIAFKYLDKEDSHSVFRSLLTKVCLIILIPLILIKYHHLSTHSCGAIGLIVMGLVLIMLDKPPVK